jgi:hypothetical protein
MPSTFLVAQTLRDKFFVSYVKETIIAGYYKIIFEFSRALVQVCR